MEQDIASYLFRNGYCVLPGIGKLTVSVTSAETDFINSQIKAPVPTIIFSADQKNASIFNELSAVSEHLKMMLDSQKNVSLNGIGTFEKDNSGNIHFISESVNADLLHPVKVERVIHRDVKHTIQVGDSEVSSTITADGIYHEEKKKDRWWIAAMVAALVGIISLIIIFSQNNSNNSASGNRTMFDAKTSDSTYHSR